MKELICFFNGVIVGAVVAVLYVFWKLGGGGRP